MKTAKEMFEELGYKYIEHDYNFEYRKHTQNNDNKTKKETDEIIYFLITEFRFICEQTTFYKVNTSKNSFSSKIDEGKEITIEEYKAITQQMKELGWLDE